MLLPPSKSVQISNITCRKSSHVAGYTPALVAPGPRTAFTLLETNIPTYPTILANSFISCTTGHWLAIYYSAPSSSLQVTAHEAYTPSSITVDLVQLPQILRIPTS